MSSFHVRAWNEWILRYFWLEVIFSFEGGSFQGPFRQRIILISTIWAFLLQKEGFKFHDDAHSGCHIFMWEREVSQFYDTFDGMSSFHVKVEAMKVLSATE